MAAVRDGDQARRRAPGRGSRWNGSTSANTGVAPQYEMAHDVEMNVWGVVITSSPGPTPAASSARCSAEVPEFTPMQWRRPTVVGEASLEALDRGAEDERPVATTSDDGGVEVVRGCARACASRSDEGDGHDSAARLRRAGQRAGFPATVAPGATSRVTTDPAPTTASSPMVTPGRMTAPEPMARATRDDRAAPASQSRLDLQRAVGVGRSRTTVVGEAHVMPDEHLVLDGHPVADEAVARHLAARRRSRRLAGSRRRPPTRVPAPIVAAVDVAERVHRRALSRARTSLGVTAQRTVDLARTTHPWRATGRPPRGSGPPAGPARGRRCGEAPGARTIGEVLDHVLQTAPTCRRSATRRRPIGRRSGPRGGPPHHRTHRRRGRTP